MSSIAINRADLFPVGTSVVLVAAGSGRASGPPTGVAVDTQTVASNGVVTLTGTANVPYAACASVGGSYRRLYVQSSAFAPRSPWPWKAVVAARRAAIGTS